jgi:competence protein ComEC
MAGIAAGGVFPFGYIPGFAVCAIAAGAALTALVKGRPARISPLLLSAGLGYLALQPLLVAPPPGHVAGCIDRGRCRIVGTVCRRPIAAHGRQRFVLEVESAGPAAGPARKATGLLRVTAAGQGPLIDAGDRVRFEAHVRGFRNFENPGGFNYRRYMSLQGIRASAYLSGKELSVIGKRGPGPVDAFRNALSAFIERRIEMPAAGVLKALLLGDRQGIEPPVREAFNRAGVGHILAISGLHVGIVAGAAFFLIRRLLSLIPIFLRRAWTRKGAAIFSLAAVIGYGLLAGMSPSTHRAVVMVCAFMAALVLGRQTDPINSLALAALAILIWDPGALFSVSFQLSFAAAGAILYGLEADRRPFFFEGGLHRLLQRTALFVYVSLLAILGTLPLTAFYFNRVSLVGLAANCMAIPLIGFFVLPVGLLSVLLFGISPALAGVGFDAAARVLEAAVAGIGLFADLPHAALRVVTPSLLEVGIYYVLLFSVLNLRRRKWACTAVAAALLLAGADVCHWVQHRLWHPELRVHFMDVGQGAASLIELPRGKCILIDGGGFSDNRIFDVGAAVVAPFLWRNKIRTLDTVILTHPNSDHLNGLIFILENFRVHEIWTNGQAVDTEGYRQLTASIREREIPAPAFDRIGRNRRLNGVDLEILHPPIGFLNRADEGPWRDPNNNSITVKAGFGGVSFLFPGDAMAAAEQEMTRLRCPELTSTVLAAPHHGSRTSSTPAFLDCVCPEVVIVSAGRRLRQYFPHPIVQRRYRVRHLQLYSTYRHGAVTVTSDGKGYRVETVLDVPSGTGKGP